MFIFLLVSFGQIYAQAGLAEEAGEAFTHKDYSKALSQYKQLLQYQPNNSDYNYRIGYSILHLYMDKKKAIPYLQKAIAGAKIPNDAYYYLALAYHYDLQFKKAEQFYKKYQAIGKGTKLSLVPRQLEMLRNAEKLVPAPINVTFSHLGKNVNTVYPDYYPFCTADGSMIMFTSRRAKNKGGMREFDGYYPSDVWASYNRDGHFVKAVNCHAINTVYDEEAVGLTFSGDTAFIYKDNIKDVGDIFYSKKTRNRYQLPIKLGSFVNSKDFEGAATISPDGQTMFFTSDRKGGFGKKDIWMTRKLPNGKWALPQDLGANINSKYDEDFPQLFFDGKTLYFSSDGRNSMGGYDLFKSEWNPQKNTWSPAKNLGYPINTPEDQRTICFTKDKRHAFISAWRPDSYGSLDIYEVTFNDVAPLQSIIKGFAMSAGDSTNAIKHITLSVTDNFNNKLVGRYTSNPNNGSFVLILKPGSYSVSFEADGFKTQNQTLIVAGSNKFKPFIKKKFFLNK